MDSVQCIGVDFCANLLNGLPDEPMFSMLGTPFPEYACPICLSASLMSSM